MRMKLFFSAALALGAVAMVSCDDDDDVVCLDPVSGIITLNIQGLAAPSDIIEYEGWLVVDGTPTSTGRFTVTDDGEITPNTFHVTIDPKKETKFVVTVEPKGELDTDPGPSAAKLLSGKICNYTAELDYEPVVADFMGARGTYIKATPTDNVGEEGDPNFRAGIWFLAPPSGEETTPSASLVLPELASGWVYETWIVFKDKNDNSKMVPVGVGQFSDPAGPDDFGGFSGTLNPAPPFPGEDMLMNLPGNIDYDPTDLDNGLAGNALAITVEPDLGDLDDPAPFGALKILENPSITPLPTGQLQNLAIPLSGKLTFEKQ